MENHCKRIGTFMLAVAVLDGSLSTTAYSMDQPRNYRPDAVYGESSHKLEIEAIEKDDLDNSEQAGIAEQSLSGILRGSVSELAAEQALASVRWSAWYFGLFFGPSVTDPTARYQPGFDGELDPGRPVVLKNYLNLGYSLSDSIQLTVTAPWTMAPIDDQKFLVRDPSIRLSHNSLLSSGSFNFYGDIRIFFPVTPISRDEDLLAGFQTFVFPSIDSGKWTFAVWASAQSNFYGDAGRGNDLELYLGPNASMQISDKLAVNLLFEMGASHVFGAPAWQLTSDGTGLQPGVSWDITPNFNLSPFLNISITQAPGIDTTSIGASLWWRML
jgi:hypothetical protein